MSNYTDRVIKIIAHQAVLEIEDVKETDTLEDLHNIITQSFGFEGTEMASFYLSDNQWNQGEEISLFDLSEETVRGSGGFGSTGR